MATTSHPLTSRRVEPAARTVVRNAVILFLGLVVAGVVHDQVWQAFHPRGNGSSVIPPWMGVLLIAGSFLPGAVVGAVAAHSWRERPLLVGAVTAAASVVASLALAHLAGWRWLEDLGIVTTGSLVAGLGSMALAMMSRRRSRA